MSGNNRQGDQGGQSGQSRRQAPQGQQQRGSQQAQRGQPPQGGGRPPQRGAAGGSSGGIDTDVLRNIVLWGVSAFIITGLVLGVVPFLYGFAGDANGATQTVDANSTAAQERANEQQVANNVVSNELSSDNASAAEAYDQMRSQNSIIRNIIGLGPYFGVLLGVVTALLIGLRSSADDKTLAAGVAVAIVVGLTLFVVLSTAIAGFQYNGMSQDDWRNQYNTDPADWGSGYPSSDIDGESQQQYIDDYQDQYGGQPTQGLVAASSISSIRTIPALSISYGTVFINSLLFGIVSALGGAGIAVASKRLSEIIE